MLMRAGRELLKTEGLGMLEMTRTVRTVLVIEREPALRCLLTTLLADAGYGVITAKDGADACRLIGERPIDIIVVDVPPPVGRAIGVLEAFHDKPSAHTIPVVVLTTQSMAGINGGKRVSGVVSMPFDVDDLLAHIDRAARHGARECYKPTPLVHA